MHLTYEESTGLKGTLIYKSDKYKLSEFINDIYFILNNKYNNIIINLYSCLEFENPNTTNFLKIYGDIAYDINSINSKKISY